MYLNHDFATEHIRSAFMKLVSPLSTALLAIVFTGCSSKQDPEPSADIQVDALSRTWQLSSVSVDGVIKNEFSELKLTLIGTHGSATLPYITTGNPPISPWKAAGIFVLSSVMPKTTMSRSDPGTAIPFTYAVSKTQLILSFEYVIPGYTSSNSADPPGNWIFTMTPVE